jgi:hypothetical protein
MTVPKLVSATVQFRSVKDLSRKWILDQVVSQGSSKTWYKPFLFQPDAIQLQVIGSPGKEILLAVLGLDGVISVTLSTYQLEVTLQGTSFRWTDQLESAVNDILIKQLNTNLLIRRVINGQTQKANHHAAKAILHRGERSSINEGSEAKSYQSLFPAGVDLNQIAKAAVDMSPHERISLIRSYVRQE